MAINGTAGNDTINALDGIDYLYGGDGDDYLYNTAVGDSIVSGAGYDRLYINQFSSTTPFTLNYTNSASGTTYGGGSLKEVEYIDFRGETSNDNINTSSAYFFYFI